ncbi:endothelial cell-selective adhesion molecule-like [Stegodyphus dumicola]|uniref:endothelial cell-selective adhesion molecule-like n=1 Tax=Stegodyphus dumicola TaxID=202533 RepID=UPI0015B0FC7A|nr:endothelial cell-selective adhesion molecule-like [Stegodyphus dumicola]XP_035213868.1 endothelial cell-selective adhesion molecule-like [Stegodyphus dumicola]
MNMPRNAIVIFIAIIVLSLAIGKSVKVTELRVPSAAVLGESVTLVCSYELGSEELYVVKWYKDDLEFYRYEPKDDNQSIYFPQPGIDIDLSKSGSNVVFLRNVALDSAGTYKCQVSTDSPTYSCVQAVKEMNIIILPLEGPTISGGQMNYDSGDNVTLNCTSAKSKPAAELRWFINGQPVPTEETVDQSVIPDSDNLQVSSATLRLQITEKLFQKGKIAIKCEASFYGRVAMLSKEITIREASIASQFCFGVPFLPFYIYIIRYYIMRFVGFPS